MKTFRVGPENLTRWVLAAAVLLFGAAAGSTGATGTEAQQSQQSVADAAKRARAEKKPPAKATRVFTTDTVTEVGVGTASGAGAATSEGAASGEGAVAATGEAGGAADSRGEQIRSENSSEIAAEKARLAKLQSELDLLERDSSLKRQQHYNDPAYADKRAGKSEIDGIEAQVAAKKDEIAACQQRIVSLEAKSKDITAIIGPRQEPPLNEDQQRARWAGRMRPLLDELARLEAEIAAVRQSASAEPSKDPSKTSGGSFSVTGNQVSELEKKRAAVQQRIAALEDDARRAGVPPSWLR